ncbi:MAG: hypothetical protein JWQ27_579 [Ferruginibacter sp.]|nr:hypothetical protein [Ferruginibacter sp.]
MKWIHLVLVTFCFASALQAQKHEPGEITLLVGTYTSGKSEGIYLYDFDTTSGAAMLQQIIKAEDPSYLAVAADSRHFYAVNESGKAKGFGKVTAYAVDSIAHWVSYLNRQPSLGEHPCYLSIDNSGRWLAVSNYSSGNFSVMPINNDGSLGSRAEVVQHTGHGTDTIRQDKPHVHSAVFSPDNKYLLVADLGLDELSVYSFDQLTGKVGRKSVTKITPGGGPRHFVFSESGRHVYALEEMSGMLNVFRYRKGKLHFKQRLSAVSSGFTGKTGAADIHRSGKFIYSSNRGDENAIAIFSANKKGKLRLVGHQSTLGKTPRNFVIDPSGKFLLAANQNSDEIVIFKRDIKTGLLTDSGKRIKTPNPVCLKWLQAPTL